MERHDYAFSFRIDSASRRGATVAYAAHVDQMIRQVLLTSPGERIDVPEFGCGLRQLVFAPHTDALNSTVNLIVLQALNRWLAGIIDVQKVTVDQSRETADLGQFIIEIDYVLLATNTNSHLQVLVS
jgi:phage baseplate assembly protein W